MTDPAVSPFDLIREALRQRDAAVREAETLREAQTAEETTCPDCGIPLTWCRRVTSNPAHCWRWDDEALRARLRDAEEALRYYARIEGHPVSGAKGWDSGQIARAYFGRHADPQEPA